MSAETKPVLYTHPMSPHGNIVVDFLAGAGLIDRVDEVVLDFAKGEHKAPAFLAVNPAGQVSGLRDNKAGGEDSHTFTGGYQIGSSAERLTLNRDYIDPEFSSGDDLESWWSERVWRVNPERKFCLESGPVSMGTAHWLGTDLFESADVYAYVAGSTLLSL